jgi:drug/metabolite transporter (DMT)-like permease
MRAGIVFALLSAVLFGASTPLAKLILGAMDPWMLAALLYLGAGLGLAAVSLTRRALRYPVTEAPLVRRDLPWLAAVILTGGVLGPLFLMLGLARTDAASAALLLNLEGVATLAIAWVAFRENVDRRLFLGAAALIAGAAVLGWQGGAKVDPGAGLIVLACLCWGIDNNLTRRLSLADPVQIAMLKGLVAGVVNLCLALAAGAALPQPPAIIAAMMVGFFGYGVSLTLFVLALRHLGAARTGAYYAIAPFAGAALSVAIFATPVTVQLILAGGLMAIGLWLHLTEDHDHTHEHPELVHSHRHRHDAHHQHDHPPGLQVAEPHSHLHRHAPMVHRHPHYPDLHHRHGHRHAPVDPA